MIAFLKKITSSIKIFKLDLFKDIKMQWALGIQKDTQKTELSCVAHLDLS